MTDDAGVLSSQGLAPGKTAQEESGQKQLDYLTAVSHELRTTMNTLTGMAALLQKTRLDIVQQEYVRAVQDSTNALLALINNVMDYAALEAGTLELSPAYFSLNRLLFHLHSTYKNRCTEKRLNFVCAFADTIPAVILGDEKRLHQVLDIHLDNALKYTSSGQISFSVSQEADGRLCFAIRDTGSGIKEEDISQLFSMFARQPKNQQISAGGRGLGMAISRQLCLLMGGDIHGESHYGVGSSFILRLPLPAGQEEDLELRDLPNMSFIAPTANILLVDDIDINLLVATTMLEPFQIKVDTALSGQEALAKVKESAYDLIFMDHLMPGMDGIATTQAIRALGGRAAATPIVALTATAVSGAKEMFCANNFNGFLAKPLDIDMLRTSLLRWLPRSLIIPISQEE